jgi:CDP-2,3-bis-(O-geranylgeranyl)-sn-glycerol synthase
MQTLLYWITGTFFFLLPAYVANLSCPFAKYILGETPINEKWFGHHKTWQGLFAGILIGTSIGFLIPFLPIINYYITINPILFAFIGSFGAVMGDIIKSFFKRRIGIQPGQPWIPFDQLDFIIGAMLLTILINPFPTEIAICGFIITPILHFTANILAFKLKIKKVWW